MRLSKAGHSAAAGTNVRPWLRMFDVEARKLPANFRYQQMETDWHLTRGRSRALARRKRHTCKEPDPFPCHYWRAHCPLGVVAATPASLEARSFLVPMKLTSTLHGNFRLAIWDQLASLDTAERPIGPDTLRLRLLSMPLHPQTSDSTFLWMEQAAPIAHPLSDARQ